MMKLYKYLYYRLYTWNLRVWGTNDAPEWNAALGISGLMFLNIALVIVILKFINFNIFSETIPKVPTAIAMLCLIGLNYLQFVRKQKYLEIVELFRNESEKEKTIRAYLLWLYVLGSFGLVILFAYLNRDPGIL